MPVIVQFGEVDGITAALLGAAREGCSFLDLRTIHLEEITGRIMKIEESLDPVARPRLRGFDAVVTQPGDHRQEIFRLDEKRIVRKFCVLSGRAAWTIRESDNDPGNAHLAESGGAIVDVMNELPADNFGEKPFGLVVITAIDAGVSERSELR